MKRFVAIVTVLAMLFTVNAPMEWLKNTSAAAENTTPVTEANSSEGDGASKEKTSETKNEQAAESTPAPTEGGTAEKPAAEDTSASGGGDGQNAEGTETDGEQGADETESGSDGEQDTEDGEPAQETIVLGSGAAYRVDGNVITYGDPASMIRELVNAGQGGTIYLCQKVSFSLTEMTVDAFQASGVTIALDGAATDDPEDMVIVSNVSRGGQMEKNVVFIWVGHQSSIPTAGAVDSAQSKVSSVLSDAVTAAAIEITVQPIGYSAQEACTPTFQLSASVALEDGQSFGVSINGGRAMALQDSAYMPTATGSYSFCVLSADGRKLASSTEYEVTYLQSAPDAGGEADATIDSDDENASGDEPADEDGGTDAPVQIVLEVAAQGYEKGASLNEPPTFTLYGKPDDGAYQYAVVNGGQTAVFLSTNEYTVEESGDYSLRFYIVEKGEANSAVAESSDVYDFHYDAPAMLAQAEATLKSGTRDDSEAWMNQGGEVYGSLEALLSSASAGETVYLLAAGPITLNRSTLGGVTLLPDSTNFNNHYVKVVAGNGSLTVSVVENASGSTGVPTSLTVNPSADYLDGAWSNQPPTFTLTPNQTLQSGQSLAVYIDGAVTPIEVSSPYAASDAQGKHSYVFAVLDGAGQAISDTKSGAYAVWLDTVAPDVSIAVQNGTMTITATDTVSLPKMVSIDGGSSWSALSADTKTGKAVWKYNATKDEQFAASSILVRDTAGNQFANGNPIAVKGGTHGATTGGSRGGMSAGGGTGGSGATTRTVYHASSDSDSTMAYNAVDLEVEDLAMNTLTVGDRTLDLTLYDQNKTEALFTAGLAHWNAEKGVSENAAEGDATADTLVLTAVISSADSTDFEWSFTGSVYKKLAASGIDYLVLKVGENVTAIATSGFTAGIRYDLLKSGGTASKAFEYRVDMSINGTGMKMDLNVNDQTYALTGDTNREIYYYDVYSGSTELLTVAFGAYTAANQG